MRWRHTTLSPWFRSLAAMALVVFVAAQARCFVHCHFGGGHGEEAHPSCHGSPQTTASHDGHDDHDGPTPSTPATTSTCSTLQTMLPGGEAPALVPPPHHTLYLLAPIALALDATETQPQAPFFRQAWPRDWVLTPEVCLGPAHRSHAPPSLS